MDFCLNQFKERQEYVCLRTLRPSFPFFESFATVNLSNEMSSGLF